MDGWKEGKMDKEVGIPLSNREYTLVLSILKPDNIHVLGHKRLLN